VDAEVIENFNEQVAKEEVELRKKLRKSLLNILV
jgi:hypothetical protein